MRDWVDSLSSEPEKDLQDFGARLRLLVEQGDQALDRRRKAAVARSDHRVRTIAPLIDEINRVRLSLYGSLTQLAAENHLARGWADRFFRHNMRTPKEEPHSVVPVIHPIRSSSSLAPLSVGPVRLVWKLPCPRKPQRLG